MVSEGSQHGYGAGASICQGKSAKLVKDARHVGDRGKQPVKVVLVDSLGEECDNPEDFACNGAEFAKSWGGK